MTTTSNTIFADDSFVDPAFSCARGKYQRNLLDGIETWSGSSLRGNAKSWSGRYAASRRALLERLGAAGVPHEVVTGPHGKLVLVVGATGGAARALLELEVIRTRAVDPEAAPVAIALTEAAVAVLRARGESDAADLAVGMCEKIRDRAAAVRP